MNGLTDKHRCTFYKRYVDELIIVSVFVWINHGGNDTDQLLLTCPLLDEVDNRTSRGNHVMGVGYHGHVFVSMLHLDGRNVSTVSMSRARE